jgi:hypothetical protein
MNATAATRFEQAIEQALAAGDYDEAERRSAQYRHEAGDDAPAGDVSASPWFRARAYAAQVALDGGFLRRTVERLQPLLGPRLALPDGLACRLWLYEAEARARLGELPQARQALERAQSLTAAYRGNVLFRLRGLRVRLMLGEVRGLGAELDECRRALASDPRRLVLLQADEARAWEAAGESERAAACWGAAERLLPAGASGLFAADVYLHQGRLRHLRGHLQDALDYYQRGLRAAPPECRPQVAGLRLRKALVDLELGQWRRGAALWQELRGLEPWPEELLPLVQLVRALLEEDAPADGPPALRAYQTAAGQDWELARTLYRRAFDQAAGAVERARLTLALGYLALHGGSGAEAAGWLERAEELARRHDLPEVLWRALHARGRLAAELDRDEGRARALFEEAVTVSERQRRRLRSAVDAAAYQLRPGEVTRRLLEGACRRGDAEAVFHYQELLRGRLLLDLTASAGAGLPLPRLQELDRELAALEEQIRELGTNDPPRLEALQARHDAAALRRDRLLEEYLDDRTRPPDERLPPLPRLADLVRALPPGHVYVAPAEVEGGLYLLVARRGGGARVVPAPGTVVGPDAFHDGVRRQLDAYRHGRPPGQRERAQLDAILEQVGAGALGEALCRVTTPGERLLWVPDGAWHGFPVAALRRGGRYFVADREVVHLFSGAQHLAQQRGRPGWWRRRGRSLVVAEAPAVLPGAAEEARGVSAALARPTMLLGGQARLEALRPLLPGAAVLHCACHALFDERQPLRALVRLPSGENWHALQWLGEPVRGLPLAALSACHSAEVGALLGREMFGLVAAALAGGVRAVLSCLWAVPDGETVPFMWRYYQQRLTGDLATALARTQREAAAVSSPLYWALFVLFGDAAALPAPRWALTRWLAARRRRRLERRFPTPLALTA